MIKTLILAILLLTNCSTSNKPNTKNKDNQISKVIGNEEEVILYTVDNKKVEKSFLMGQFAYVLPGKHELTASFNWITNIPVASVNVQTSNSSNTIQKICFFAKNGETYSVNADPITEKIYVSGALINLFESENVTIPCN